MNLVCVSLRCRINYELLFSGFCFSEYNLAIVYLKSLKVHVSMFLSFKT